MLATKGRHLMKLSTRLGKGIWTCIVLAITMMVFDAILSHFGLETVGGCLYVVGWISVVLVLLGIPTFIIVGIWEKKH